MVLQGVKGENIGILPKALKLILRGLLLRSVSRQGLELLLVAVVLGGFLVVVNL